VEEASCRVGCPSRPVRRGVLPVGPPFANPIWKDLLDDRQLGSPAVLDAKPG